MTHTRPATLPPGRRLRALLELAVPGLWRRAELIWHGEPADAAYRRWLQVSHAMMRATIPLLTDARDECARRRDPVSAKLRGYFADQIEQEHGHEEILRDDYVGAGGRAAELTEPVAPGAVARLVGAQYYWIRHEHPLALAAHIAVLEWFPPGPALGSGLAARTGLPAAAFSTLELHAAADTEHGAALLRLLDGLPLPARLGELLSVSALTTVEGLDDVIDAITRKGT